jgi:(p)ppGpp synthase/HD superfamily hydrolase
MGGVVTHSESESQGLPMEKFEKLKISLRYYLHGASDMDPSYRNPLDALDFALSTHTGLRKDGVTLEVSHQIETAHFLRTLRRLLIKPAATLSVMLLHDAMEDYSIPLATFKSRFGDDVAHGVNRMSKIKDDGTKLSNEEYFEAMLDCPMATVCKGADRIHNQNSMVGVFAINKQHDYINETETFILPMLKKARRIYTAQEDVYENINLILTSQIKLLKSLPYKI